MRYFRTFAAVLIGILLIQPVSAVYAGEYSTEVPYLEGIEFNMQANDLEDRGGLDLFMKNKNISDFIFTFPQLDGIEYENYDVVFDMVLKSKLEDESITTHAYSTSFDVNSTKPGFWDDLLMGLGFKDDYFSVTMDFGALVQNSPDVIAKEKTAYDSSTGLTQTKYVYNTVITQIDIYLRDKSTGNYGLVSRFKLSWDVNFYWALCTNITYELVDPAAGEIKESGSISNASGAYGYDSTGDNTTNELWALASNIAYFLTDIPGAIVALVTGFYGFATEISGLFAAVFPFLPGIIFDIFGILLFLSPAVGIWFLVKGK